MVLGHGLCKIEALDHVTALFRQEFHLSLILHAFRNGMHVQALRKPNGLGHDDLTAPSLRLSAEEIRIQLKHVQRHVLQGIQIRIARAKVIHGNLKSIFFQPLNGLDHGILVIKERALRELDLNEIARRTGRIHHVLDLLCQVTFDKVRA